MISHTGERPYACRDSSCGRSFAKRNSLKVHLAKHGISDTSGCGEGGDGGGSGSAHSGDETASIGREVLNSVNPDEIRLTSVPSVDGVQGESLFQSNVRYYLKSCQTVTVCSLLPAYAVIPLSAESVSRMTQRSGLSLQQLLTDRHLALAPVEESSSGDFASGHSSNVDDTTDSSSMDVPRTGVYNGDS